MNDIFHVFEFICAYIDKILILTKGCCKDNVYMLKSTVNKLKVKGLNYYIKKSFFGQTEMEYLGLWVTHYGLQPIYNKIEEIKNMTPPTF